MAKKKAKKSKAKTSDAPAESNASAESNAPAKSKSKAPVDELEVVLLPPGSGRRVLSADKAQKLVDEKKALIIGPPKTKK